MSQIWKFPVPLAPEKGYTEISAPGLGMILHVGDQRGEVTLWAPVMPGYAERTMKVWVVGTGQDSPRADAGYVGTVQMNDGVFVWHVYMAYKRDIVGRLP